MAADRREPPPAGAGTPPATPPGIRSPIRLWDAPTRLVHWSLVLLVPFSWWSATHDHLDWHRLSGYLILGLVTFRLGWGVAGPRNARFATFLKGPAAVLAYARGRAAPSGYGGLGHNPLGGWSIAAMLAAFLLQVSLGLFSVDEDGLEAGPLSRLIAFETSRAVAKLHHLTFWLLVALIALHLAAVAFYTVRGRNLVGPMITGRALPVPGAPVPRPNDAEVPAWRAFAIAVLAAAFVWFVVRGVRL